jgi:hypothetical protein
MFWLLWRAALEAWAGGTGPAPVFHRADVIERTVVSESPDRSVAGASPTRTVVSESPDRTVRFGTGG